MLSSVVRASRFLVEYTTLLLMDIPEEEMTHSAGGIVNHPAWQVGHIIFVWNRVGKALGLEKDDSMRWTVQCAPGGKPTGDRANFPSKSEMLASLVKSHDALVNLLQSARPEALDATLPDEKQRAMFPTIGDAVVFALTAHTGTHLGQLSAWRRARGMPFVF